MTPARRKGIDRERQRARQRIWVALKLQLMHRLGLSTARKRWGQPVLYPRYTDPSMSPRERQKERQRRYRERNAAKGLTTNGTPRIKTCAGHLKPMELAWRQFKASLQTGADRLEETV